MLHYNLEKGKMENQLGLIPKNKDWGTLSIPEMTKRSNGKWDEHQVSKTIATVFYVTLRSFPSLTPKKLQLLSPCPLFYQKNKFRHLKNVMSSSIKEAIRYQTF
jgi:hypothetical protein